MTLDQYLRQPGALTVAQLREAVGAKSDAQVRQWQHGYAARLPGPIYCVAIERATAGAVTRRDLRPDDWAEIWPELAEAAGEGVDA
jgi:DNA-binding transcriptional regulator YdaS (Cro superfamily)